jgi:hypothetical protein
MPLHTAAVSAYAPHCTGKFGIHRHCIGGLVDGRSAGRRRCRAEPECQSRTRHDPYGGYLSPAMRITANGLFDLCTFEAFHHSLGLISRDEFRRRFCAALPQRLQTLVTIWT